MLSSTVRLISPLLTRHNALFCLAGAAWAKGSDESCANTCNCPNEMSCTHGVMASKCCWAAASSNPGLHRRLAQSVGQCKVCPEGATNCPADDGSCPPPGDWPCSGVYGSGLGENWAVTGSGLKGSL
jgi:hypothetical protein